MISTDEVKGRLLPRVQWLQSLSLQSLSWLFKLVYANEGQCCCRRMEAQKWQGVALSRRAYKSALVYMRDMRGGYLLTATEIGWLPPWVRIVVLICTKYHSDIIGQWLQDPTHMLLVVLQGRHKLTFIKNSLNSVQMQLCTTFVTNMKYCMWH